MKTTSNNRHGRFAHGLQELRKPFRPIPHLIVLIATAVAALAHVVGPPIIGSPGGGFQPEGSFQ
jgi:hypothetical protein